MQFINEENPFRMFLHFFNDFLQSFFKFTSVLGTGNHRGHIERNNMAVLKNFRNVIFNNSLCQSFCNGCLTNPWFTNQNRVVLVTTGQNLNNPVDFIGSANDRINLPLLSPFVKIDCIIAEIAQCC